MLDIQHILSPTGPRPVGPFSHAVCAGDFMFVTGQMPTIPNDPTIIVDGGIEEQTRQVMENLRSVLNSKNLDFDRVVFARVYLVNSSSHCFSNQVYYEKLVLSSYSTA